MKTYSVKGFFLREKPQIVILDENAKQKPSSFERVFNLIANDLSWEQAKKVRNANSQYGAMIFPNMKSELKVIQLSPQV